MRGKLGLVFAGDLASLMFLIETALFVYPLVVLMSPRGRGNALAAVRRGQHVAGRHALPFQRLPDHPRPGRAAATSRRFRRSW